LARADGVNLLRPSRAQCLEIDHADRRIVMEW
jgi:hypothetical protein